MLHPLPHYHEFLDKSVWIHRRSQMQYDHDQHKKGRSQQSKHQKSREMEWCERISIIRPSYLVRVGEFFCILAIYNFLQYKMLQKSMEV